MAFSKQKRRKLIATIIANELFDEDAKESLHDLTDNQLVALSDADALDTLVNDRLDVNEENDDTDVEEDVTDNDESEEDEDETTVNKDISTYSDAELADEMKKRKGKKVTGNTRTGNPAEEAKAIEEYLERTNAPAPIRQLIANQVAQDEEARANYIEVITSNESADWSDDELASMSTPELARISKLCDNQDDTDYMAASDWSAANGAFSLGANRGESSETPLGVTGWDYDEE